MPEPCQSCRTRPIEVNELYEPDPLPYRLCIPCHRRLVDRALRPLEYFNLAAIHGPAYELHDDFYDENGEACDPEKEVEPDESLSFPTLAELRHDVRRLVDYTIVKCEYLQAATPYLQAFQPTQVLHVLDEKLATNPQLLPGCLEVAAEALGLAAHSWVRYLFTQYSGPDRTIFAHALARCLPATEAEPLVLGALGHLSERELREQISCLRYFSGNGPLDWLEAQRGRITTVADSYGMTCAALGVTWPRLQRWLHLGRPLSLIALDALVQCSASPETLHMVWWLRQHPPRLHQPTSIDEMNQTLDEYLIRDNVPRTKNAIGFIKQNWPQILKAEV